jgi:mono/diheme cytochrome c family protein
MAEQGDVAAGKVTYDRLCAMCHGKAGKGDGPTAAVLNPKPRDHTKGDYMNALQDDYLFKIIKEGGASVGKSQLMPAWNTQVNDKGIWDLVAFVRTLAVPPYKPAAAAAASKAAVAPAPVSQSTK